MFYIGTFPTTETCRDLCVKAGIGPYLLGFAHDKNGDACNCYFTADFLKNEDTSANCGQNILTAQTPDKCYVVSVTGPIDGGDENSSVTCIKNTAWATESPSVSAVLCLKFCHRVVQTDIVTHQLYLKFLLLFWNA